MKKTLFIIIIGIMMVISSCKKEPAPQTIFKLKVTYATPTVTAANLTGPSPSGTIHWGDGDETPWQADAQHRYTDDLTEHLVEIHTTSTGAEISSLLGVTKIDVSDF